ncbi:MAG: putative lipid II flippase FtsW [Candidatus Hydrogenedentales bacterium]
MKRETLLLLVTVMILSSVGLVLVFSASPAYTSVTGKDESKDMFHFLSRQVIFLALGFSGMLALSRIDYHVWSRRWAYMPVVVIALALLVLVLAIGAEINNSRRWIALPIGTLQPSELAKFAVIIFLAVKLAENQRDIGSLRRGFLPPVFYITLFAGLVVLEEDLSTPMVIACSGMLMVGMAGARWPHLLLSACGGAAMVVFLCMTSPERVRRLMAFRDPWGDRFNDGMQLVQSLAGFARGGVWGQGVGAGEQKLFYLHAANNDFIFSVWGEEMGLLGTLSLVVLFALFLIVGTRVALCAPDLLGALLAAGVVSMIAMQAGINMGVTTGLLPTTGLPLPFISAGGSALIVNLAMVGLLLNVAQQASEPEPKGRRLAAARA